MTAVDLFSEVNSVVIDYSQAKFAHHLFCRLKFLFCANMVMEQEIMVWFVTYYFVTKE